MAATRRIVDNGHVMDGGMTVVMVVMMVVMMGAMVAGGAWALIRRGRRGARQSDE